MHQQARVRVEGRGADHAARALECAETFAILDVPEVDLAVVRCTGEQTAGSEGHNTDPGSMDRQGTNALRAALSCKQPGFDCAVEAAPGPPGAFGIDASPRVPAGVP